MKFQHVFHKLDNVKLNLCIIFHVNRNNQLKPIVGIRMFWGCYGCSCGFEFEYKISINSINALCIVLGLHWLHDEIKVYKLAISVKAPFQQITIARATYYKMEYHTNPNFHLYQYNTMVQAFLLLDFYSSSPPQLHFPLERPRPCHWLSSAPQPLAWSTKYIF